MSIACICTVNFVFPATHFVSWLLCTAVLWTSMYKLPLRNSAFTYTQKWVQNQVVVLVSSFSGTFTLVSIEVRQFYNTTNRAHGFQFLHIPTQTCYFLSLKKSGYPNKYEDDYWYWVFFHTLLCHLYLSLTKYFFQDFCSF